LQKVFIYKKEQEMKRCDTKIRVFVLIGVLFLGVSSVYAETIVLKSGKTVEGKIIEKTDKYIKIDFQGVPLTYFIDEIESIDGENRVSPVSNQGTTNQTTEIRGNPIIKVDYDHWMIERSDGSSAQKYELPECENFVIDATGYSFDNTPNLIMVSMGEEYKYGIAWETDITTYTISKETLSPLSGSKPFPGFKAGQEIVIMIGHIDMNTKDFYPYWYSLVNIEK
jgi:hypothetical protein